LKPDVCRRVVGRLPSPHIRSSSLKLLWFQQRGMAPLFSLHSHPRVSSKDTREVHSGLSCEIVSDLCPNPLSHDWHVQPSCQRPNRLPPERRAFSSRRMLSVWDRVFDPVSRAKLDQDPLDTIRLSSKPFNHIVRARPCQPAHPTAFPPVFHMRNLLWTRLPGSSTSIVEERPFRAASDLHLEGFSPCRARTLRSAQRYGLPLQRRQVRRTPKRKSEN